MRGVRPVDRARAPRFRCGATTSDLRPASRRSPSAGSASSPTTDGPCRVIPSPTRPTPARPSCSRELRSGSSRTRAPGAHAAGDRGVRGPAFSEIFLANATTIGLPCLTAAAGDIESLMDRARDADGRDHVAHREGPHRNAPSAHSNPRCLPHDNGTPTGLLLHRFEEVGQVVATSVPWRLHGRSSPDQPMTTDRLFIFDTTLRDGEQAPGFSLRTEQKLRLARQLEALGVDVMEVGFPVGRHARD